MLRYQQLHEPCRVSTLTSTSTAGAKVESCPGLSVVLVPAHAEGQGDLPGEARGSIADCVATQHNVDGGAVLLVLQGVSTAAQQYPSSARPRKWPQLKMPFFCADSV